MNLTYRFLCSLPLLFASAQTAFALDTLTIEDRNLSTIPAAAKEAILSSSPGSEYSKCKFRGKKIALSNDETTALFVTTADVCGWGAAQGPIIILRHSAGSYTVVLHEVGYSVSPLEKEDQPMLPLLITGQHSKSIYRYAGGHYVRSSTADR